MATLRYDIDVDDRRAERRIGAFALSMRRQITQAVRSLPDIELNADSTPAQRELAEIRSAMVALGNQRIGVDVDAADARRQLDELTARLQALKGASGDIQIDVDAAAALAALGAVDEAVDKIDGRTAEVKIDVDKSLSDAIIKVAQLGRALGTIALPAAALSIVPQVAGIAASLVDLSGVAGLLPAVLFAGGAAAGALGIGLTSVADALGPRGTAAQIEKVDKAVASLAPNARETVAEIRGLGTVWNELRLDVQQELFQGLAEEVEELGKVGLPVLRDGLAGVASELNESARSLADWAKQGETVRDVGEMFDNTREAMRELVPAGRNVAEALLDIGTVGSRFLPELAGGVTNLTERFRNFIAQARETGQLEEWIGAGIEKAEQLGRVLGNIGGAVVAFFQAADASGSDFLDTAEKVSEELETLLRSDVAQTGIAAVFTEIGDAVDALLPGIRNFTTLFAEALAVAANTNGLEAAAGALGALLEAAGPLLPLLAALAGEGLHGVATEAAMMAGPLSMIVQWLVSLFAALGPIGPSVLGMVVAFRLLTPVTGIVAGVGTALQTLAIRLGLSEVAAGRFVTIFSRVGQAIPIVAVALIGLGIAYDAVRDKTEELAKSVLDGSQDFRKALEEQEAAVQRNAAMVAQSSGRWIAATGQQATAAKEATDATARHQQAIEQLLGSMREQADGMVGLEQAQARVKIAQVEYSLAVEDHGALSQEAAVAADILANATNDLETQQRETEAATKLLTDRIVEQSEASSAAANADVAYQQATIRVAEANERAAEVAADRSSTERDLREANLAVMQANLSAADAARRKAEADAEAAGASNVAEVGAQAYKEELMRLADQATGPTRDALLNLANGTDTAEAASRTAGLTADAQRDKLTLLADTADGPVRDAMLEAARQFDSLGGAHSSAAGQAAAQATELRKLADMASGPLRTELLRMADQISNLPDGSYTVTGTGTTSFRITSIGDVSGPGTYTGGILGVQRRYVRGGVMAGYTPGRDVHSFYSPTAGRLELSGGEAVMRPEWTRAVGAPWVNAANAAARGGGVAGVRGFLATSSPLASGGIYGAPQRLAMGGYIRAGSNPFDQQPPAIQSTLNAHLHKELTAYIIAQLKSYIAKVQAAMATGGAVSGGAAGMMAILRAVFPGLPMISGYRPGAITATGNRSYHSMNRAVDIPPNMAVFNWIASRYPGSRELIFSPAGARQIHNGQPHVYGEPTRGDHWDHIHWAMRHGGLLRLADRGLILQSGQAALNLSGMPERVLSPTETRAYGDSSSTAVVDEVVRLRGDVRMLREVLASGNGDTFNIHATDAQEGGHAARMLLRARR